MLSPSLSSSSSTSTTTTRDLEKVGVKIVVHHDDPCFWSNFVFGTTTNNIQINKLEDQDSHNDDEEEEEEEDGEEEWDNGHHHHQLYHHHNHQNDNCEQHHHSRSHHQCHPTSLRTMNLTNNNDDDNIWPTNLWLLLLLSIKSILIIIFINIQRWQPKKAANKKLFPTISSSSSSSCWRRQRWPSLRLNPVYNNNNNHHHHHCCLYNYYYCCCYMLCTIFSMFLCSAFAMNVELTTTTVTSTNYPNHHHHHHAGGGGGGGSSSNTAAEYFYAQDKLSDAQVEQFLQSLQQQNSTNQSNHNLNNGNQSISSAGHMSSSRTVQHRVVYPLSLPPPPPVAASSPPHLLASRSTPSSSSSSPSTSTSASSSSSSSSSSSTSSLIRRPLPPPTSTTTTNSFSLVTLATPSANINRITKDNNITVAKYVRLPDGHKSAATNSEEKYSDVQQWLRPVYVAPKRSSSSVSSRATTNTVGSNSDHHSNGNPPPPSSMHTDSILLFGSTDSDGSNTINEIDTAVMANNNGGGGGGSKNNDNNNEAAAAADNDNGTLSKLFQNVTFELKDEQWVAPIIALSTLNMLVIFGFECFVVYRACRTCPSRRHLFLGQMLLLGLFLCSAMGLVFVPKPSWLSCSMIRAGLGLSYTLVYAALLVKTVFLLSLHTGVYLPAEYQALLLFFILATQVAIDTQWLVYWRSSTVIDYWDGFGHAVYRCDHSTTQLLWSLSYVILLIVILAIMTFRIRGYRENHGEALFLGIVAIGQIVVWLVWIAGTMTSTPHYRDGFVAFGVVGNATMIFVIMFLPKGRQMAAFGTGGGRAGTDAVGTIGGGLVGVDRASIASSPSMYAQSFLNLKQANFGALSSGKSSSIAASGAGGYQPHMRHHSQPHYVVHNNAHHAHHQRPSSVGKSGRSSSQANATGGAYHLYQKFDPLPTTGNNTHNNNPTITTNTTMLADHLGTNSSTQTQTQQKYPARMSNSFSSHAILNSYQPQSQRSNSQDQQQQQQQQQLDLDDDPNYSNLSNIFTTSTMAAVSSSNDGSKTSPLSENISISHCSSGGSSHSNNNNSNNSRPPSVPKSKRPNLMTVANGGPTTVTQQLKSPNQDSMPPAPPPLPMARNAGGGFFYLLPPPLPPPPPPTSSNSMEHNAVKAATSSSSSNNGRQQQQQQQSWRQSSSSCCTSSYGINNHRNHHHYPGSKSVGSYHPSLPPVPSTPTMGNGLTTPIGHVPPPQLISPQEGSIMMDGCRSSTGSAIGFYFTPQFDQQSITSSSCNGGAAGGGRKASTPTTTTAGATAISSNSSNSNGGQNFKYFRGNGHHHHHHY